MSPQDRRRRTSSTGSYPQSNSLLDQPVKFRQPSGASVSITRTGINSGNLENGNNKALDRRGKEGINFSDNIIDLSGLIIDGSSNFKKKERYGDNNHNSKSRGAYQAIPNNVNDDINYDNINAIIKSRNNNNHPRSSNDENEVIQLKPIVLEKLSFREEKALVTGNFNTYSTGNASQSIELDHLNKNQLNIGGIPNSSPSSSSSSKPYLDNQNSTSRTQDNSDSRTFGGEMIGKGRAVIDQSNLGVTESSAAQMKSSDSNNKSGSSSSSSRSNDSNKNVRQELKVCTMSLSFLFYLNSLIFILNTNPSCVSFLDTFLFLFLFLSLFLSLSFSLSHSQHIPNTLLLSISTFLSYTRTHTHTLSLTLVISFFITPYNPFSILLYPSAFPFR